MRKNKRFLIILTVAALLAGAVFGGKFVLDLMYYKNAMSALTIDNVDLSRVKDGTYTGSYDARVISATVRVTVENGKITEIDLLEHKYDRGGAAEAVADKILKKQSLDVDAVSGATNSSKTIMKAIENALDKGVV